METLKLNKKTYKKILKRAIEAIRGGKVLVCPTDTVYGLVCDATNEKAVEKLYKIKKRLKRKPIPVFVSDIRMAKKIATIDSEKEKFLKNIWPGSVTVVLQAKKKRGTIGLRIPKYGLLLSLAKQLNRPLAESSANISGKPASTKIREVLRQFKGEIHQPDLILDAGNLPKSKPSTVIDLTISPPKVLRI